MGIISTITHGKFPKQSEDLGIDVNVCFHYDTKHTLKGKIVRDDVEEPFRTIIQLENGNYVLGSECQWSYMR